MLDMLKYIINKPRHISYKIMKITRRTAKTQNNLWFRVFWPESSQGTLWVTKDQVCLQAIS